MKDVRPQVFFGMLVLGVITAYAMQLGFSEIAIAAVGGVIYAVKILSDNKPKP